LRAGLTNAHQLKQGELFLTLFGLTRFAPPSRHFERGLADGTAVTDTVRRGSYQRNTV
jgi:hypothetical protein